VFNVPLDTVAYYIGHLGDDPSSQSLDWCKRKWPSWPITWLVLAKQTIAKWQHKTKQQLKKTINTRKTTYDNSKMVQDRAILRIRTVSYMIMAW